MIRASRSISSTPKESFFENALLESDARYPRLIELLPTAVAVHCDGEIVFVNPAAVALMRATSPSALLGKSIFDIMPPSNRAVILERMRRAHAEGEDLPASEQEFLTCDGKIIDTRVKAIPMIFGGRAAMMVIVTDVTELKRAEADKEKLELQVRHMQKLESLAMLAGGVAHGFNNILMAILGNLDLAIGELKESSPIRGNLVAAEAATRRAAELARQMLAYSGRGRFSIAEVRLNDVVEKTARLLEVSIPSKTIIGLNLAPDLPPIEADEAQLGQVVMNLVQNAAEAIGETSGAISIDTSAVDCDRARLALSWVDDRLPAGRYLSLSVRDSGCGMEADTVSRAFDPFFSTKFTGRGLGLPTVLGIVRGHRGAIELHSTPGEGTRVTVLLPA